MAIDEIRAKGRRFERKVWRGNALAGVLFVLLFLENAWQAWTHTDILVPVGSVLTMIAFAYVAYRYRKYGRTQPTPAALGLTSCVDVYRAQLVRQRNMESGGWRFFLPFTPGVFLTIFGRAAEAGRSTSHVVIVAGLAVALFLGCVWVNARSVRRLQQEVARLDRFAE